MATKIVTKNSSTASAVPTASDLVQGELAVNVADKRLFTEDNAGAIVELGTNPYNFTANHDGSAKLATTSTGIDVTGNVTMATGGSIVAGGVNDLILNAGESGTPDIYLQSGGSTKVKIEGSNGNVGIGTSPDFPLHVSSTGVVLGLNATSGAVSQRFNENGTARFFLSTLNGSNGLAFVNGDGTSERMRIDSSGSLLVGGTNDNPAGANVAGHALGASGYISTTRDGGFAAFLNRKTSDGEIVRFAKDGTVVGSIGTANGDLYLDSTGGELSIRINGTTLYEFDSNLFYPKVDNSKDLGHSGGRWKDLYLSGGVYLGGTGAANKLDDYEEGTWTPNQGAGLTVVGAFQSEGYYTKIGNLVTISGFVGGATSVTCSTGGTLCTNAIFTSAAAGVLWAGSVINWNADSGASCAVQQNTTNVYNGTEVTPPSARISFCITYRV